MKRILLSLALLTTVAVGAQAQGAGLSQGQAYVAPTTTPTKAKKTCPNCGITMGNITYPWQHESWCPYYRSSGGSSSSRSSSRSYGTYTAASAATTALGSLLSGLISSGFSRSTTPSPIRQEQAAKQKELMDKHRYYSSEYIQSMLADEKFWEAGDYAVVEKSVLGVKSVVIYCEPVDCRYSNLVYPLGSASPPFKLYVIVYAFDEHCGAYVPEPLVTV